MEHYNQEKRKTYIQKLVSNARAILSHQIAIPLGCRKFEKILCWIDNIEQLSEIDLSVFSEYNTAVHLLPIGIERLSYNKEYLLSEEVKLDGITSTYKNRSVSR